MKTIPYSEVRCGQEFKYQGKWWIKVHYQVTCTKREFNAISVNGGKRNTCFPESTVEVEEEKCWVEDVDLGRWFFYKGLKYLRTLAYTRKDGMMGNCFNEDGLPFFIGNAIVVRPCGFKEK